MNKITEPEDTGRETSYKVVENFINSIYEHDDHNGANLSYISHVDLWEQVNTMFHIDKEDLYTVMTSAGFRIKNIEGSLYWKVFTTD